MLLNASKLLPLIALLPFISPAPAAGACTKARRVVCPATPPWNVKGGLDAIAPLIAAGKVRINIDQTYPLAEVAQAQEHNRSGRTRGKVVIDMGVSVN